MYPLLNPCPRGKNRSGVGRGSRSLYGQVNFFFFFFLKAMYFSISSVAVAPKCHT